MPPAAHPLGEAYRMLDAFASVGVTHFDVTFLDIEGDKRGFRGRQTARQIKNSLPLLLPGLAQRQNSLIVRPHSGNVTLVQLDDLDGAALERVEDIAFLTLQTSPGNHQAWVAVSGVDDAKDFARRLRKGTGADATASGATRVAGTVNYKRKYEPDFPTVAIVQAHPGRIVTPLQLHSLSLVAPAEPAAPAAPLRASSSGGRSWPDYERCMQGAPLNHGKTGPDTSMADFFYCISAAAARLEHRCNCRAAHATERKGQGERRSLCPAHGRERNRRGVPHACQTGPIVPGRRAACTPAVNFAQNSWSLNLSKGLPVG